jgi:uncharacterized protein YtpQ (UPF0354 family)
MKLNEYYIKSLISKYESKKDEAIANLSIYLSDKNLSAIGEHSDLLTEQDRWIEEWSSANDKLEALNKIVETLKKS